MLRLATILVAAAALAAVLATAVPGVAGAAGCEVLRDAVERAECVARQEARAAARAEVGRRMAGAAPAAAAPAGRSADWQRAVEESKGVDLDSLLDARLLAAIGGLAWFWVAWRRQRARRVA